MAESFYGGRRGASVVIVKSYDSIAEMQTEFDSVACPVDYDSYVVVNIEELWMVLLKLELQVHQAAEAEEPQVEGFQIQS